MDCTTFKVEGQSLIQRTSQPDLLEKFDSEVGAIESGTEVGCITLTFEHDKQSPQERALKSCVPKQVFDEDVCTYMEELVAEIGGKKTSCSFCKSDDSLLLIPNPSNEKRDETPLLWCIEIIGICCGVNHVGEILKTETYSRIILMEADPRRSVRCVEQMSGCSRSTTHRILQERRLHPYHYTRVQHLGPTDYPIPAHRLIVLLLICSHVSEMWIIIIIRVAPERPFRIG
ncbi:hypothetical protein Zmor_001475 [Zophobas morio]|uniref:Uncharacterized protein n=1 Tax=Zophobas morio TaxID=2755281 RepID=A0AA38IYJ0_9CUCU|nr:hypothetical protein Zmor_001475 [Zophobas morio]